MANKTISLPTFFGGVSRQADSIRHANQVEEATNVLLSVRDGASKRPGSEMKFAIADLISDAEYRIHIINRDSTEQYIMIIGTNTIRVFNLSGTEFNVLISDDAATYLIAGSAGVDELRAVTVADHTILINRTVETEATTSDNYVIARDDHPDYTALLSSTPALNTYHRTKYDGGGYSAGYWKYEPGTSTFSTTVFDTVSGTGAQHASYGTSDFSAAGSGFKIPFTRLALVLSAAAWDADQLSLTETDAFEFYSWNFGDQIYIDAGTGVAVAWYTIKSKKDDNTIVLESAIAAGDNADTTSTVIGIHVTVEVDMSRETLTDMHDVALHFQDAIRAAGATEALIGWTYTGKEAGFMTITCPFRGAGTTTMATEAPDSGKDFTATGRVFSKIGGEYTITAGTGTPATDTLSPPDRWTQQPAPNQPEALLDETTMPIKIVRQPVGEGGYEDAVLADNPFAYWRLGESAGATAVDERGNNDGTYVNTPTLGATGALAGDADTAVTFNGTSEYVNCGTLGACGAELTFGGTLECWIKTTRTSGTRHFMGEAAPGGNTNFIVSLNVNGTIACTLNGTAPTASYVVTTDADPGVRDGNYHHICCVWNPDANVDQYITIYIDGQIVAATPTVGRSIPTSFSNFINFFNIARGSVTFFDGTIDEAAIYTHPLTEIEVSEHYTVGSSTLDIFFVADTIEWTPRFNGDQNTNPVPSFIGKTLADVTFHRNRFAIGADEFLVLSQAGDFFNFFILDADNLGDADPIDAALSSDKVTIISHIVPFRKTLAVFTNAGRQFEMNVPEALTPSTAALTASTSYNSMPLVRPFTAGQQLYFPATKQDTVQIHEYFYKDTEVAKTAPDISEHIGDYLGSSIQTVDGDLNQAALLILPSSSNEMFTYRAHWDDQNKVQSAWAKYTFGTNERIVDIGVIENDCYMLIENSDDYFVSRLSVPEEGATTSWAYAIRLDNRVTATGVYNSGTGLTTWTLIVEDDSLDTVVLGPDHGDDSGDVITLTKVSSTSYTAVGDYSAGDGELGRTYTMTIELSRPYARDRDGAAKLDMSLQLRKLIINHLNTGSYGVKIKQPSRNARTYSFSPRDTSVTIEGEGTHQALLMGNAKDTTISIVSSSPKPVTIATAEFTTTFTQRSL